MKKDFILALAITFTFIPIFAAFVGAELLYTCLTGQQNLGGISIFFGGVVAFVLTLCVVVTANKG